MQVFADIFFRRKPRRNFISPYTMKLPKILFSSFCPPIPPPFVFHWPHLVLLSPYYPFSSFFSFLKWRKRLLLTSVSSLCQRSGSWLSQPRILSLEIRAWQGIDTVYIEILMFLFSSSHDISISIRSVPGSLGPLQFYPQTLRAADKGWEGGFFPTLFGPLTSFYVAPQKLTTTIPTLQLEPTNRVVVIVPTWLLYHFTKNLLIISSQKSQSWDLPGGPEAKSPCSQCGEPRSDT